MGKEFAMKRILLAFCMLLIGVTSAVAVNSRDFTGVLNDAPYKIRVPDNWNGVLLLHAHWYYQTSIFPTEAEAAHSAALENFLLDRGYALAGSTFRGTGWQVKEGTEDLKALSDLFNDLVGKPKKRILMGYSAGSLIALKSAEEVPLYDGVIPMCSVVGFSPLDRDIAFAYAYATLFEWPLDWGTWYDAREGLNFDRDVFHHLLGQLIILSNPNPNDPVFLETFGKFEFIRLMLDLPFDGFYQPPSQSIDPRPAAGFLMYATTEVKAEIEAKAKGYVYENVGRVYSLSPEKKVYLATLGVNADQILGQMNNGATISAAKQQRQYGEKYFDPTGDLIMPVLSVHSKYDHVYPTYYESKLLEKVQSAASEDLLLQVYTDDVGHCSFTNEQSLRAIQAMEKWLATGKKPNSSDDTLFPTSEGFDHNHVPGPFPVGRQ
jgi:alpha-beta hydrolase superfamily lysophospholipase